MSLIENKLINIADSIRTKLGSNTRMTADEMPNHIMNIQGGGGGDINMNNYAYKVANVSNLSNITANYLETGIVASEVAGGDVSKDDPIYSFNIVPSFTVSELLEKDFIDAQIRGVGDNVDGWGEFRFQNFGESNGRIELRVDLYSMGESEVNYSLELRYTVENGEATIEEGRYYKYENGEEVIRYDTLVGGEEIDFSPYAIQIEVFEEENWSDEMLRVFAPPTTYNFEGIYTMGKDGWKLYPINTNVIPNKILSGYTAYTKNGFIVGDFGDATDKDSFLTISNLFMKSQNYVPSNFTYMWQNRQDITDASFFSAYDLGNIKGDKLEFTEMFSNTNIKEIPYFRNLPLDKNIVFSFPFIGCKVDNVGMQFFNKDLNGLDISGLFYNCYANRLNDIYVENCGGLSFPLVSNICENITIKNGKNISPFTVSFEYLPSASNISVYNCDYVRCIIPGSASNNYTVSNITIENCLKVGNLFFGYQWGPLINNFIIENLRINNCSLDETDYGYFTSGLFPVKANKFCLRNLDMGDSTTVFKMFSGANIKSIEPIDLSGTNITDVSFMFANANIPYSEVSKITLPSTVSKFDYWFWKMPSVSASQILSFNYHNAVSLNGLLSGRNEIETYTYIAVDAPKLESVSGFAENSYYRYRDGDTTSITKANISFPNSHNIKDFSYFYYGQARLKNINGFDFTNAENISHIFGFCHALQNIGNCVGWTKIKDMSWAFTSCYNITSLGSISTENVENFYNAFYLCNHLSSISWLNTAKAVDIRGMLSGCNQLAARSLDLQNVLYADGSSFPLSSGWESYRYNLDYSKVIELSGGFLHNITSPAKAKEIINSLNNSPNIKYLNKFANNVNLSGYDVYLNLPNLINASNIIINCGLNTFSLNAPNANYITVTANYIKGVYAPKAFLGSDYSLQPNNTTLMDINVDYIGSCRRYGLVKNISVNSLRLEAPFSSCNNTVIENFEIRDGNSVTASSLLSSAKNVVLPVLNFGYELNGRTYANFNTLVSEYTDVSNATLGNILKSVSNINLKVDNIENNPNYSLSFMGYNPNQIEMLKRDYPSDIARFTANGWLAE